MRRRLILEEITSELIYIKGSKIIVADALNCLDKIDYLNFSNNNNKIEPILESLSKTSP